MGASQYGAPANATDIDGTSGTDWDNTLGAPIVLSAAETLSVPAPPGVGNSRIDIIEVRADYLAASPATVGIFNAATRVFDPTVKNKRMHWDLSGRTGSAAPGASTAPISYVTGVVAAGAISAATEPATTAGYIKIARINLDASAGAIAAVTQSMVADLRPKIYPGGLLHAGAQARIPGLVGGIGAGNSLDCVALPPGCTIKAAFYNPVPPAAGKSYTLYCVLIGGDPIPRTDAGGGASCGVLTATAIGDKKIARTTGLTSLTVDASTQSIFAGTDANYTPINGTAVIPIGTKVLYFFVEVWTTDGSALGNHDLINFQLLVGQG